MPNPHPEQSCFVISPIGEAGTETRTRADDLLEKVIAPAALENGLQAVRADKISKPGAITSQVITHLRTDRLVVAVLTDHNANVFYELALRHAFKRPTVQLIDERQQIPFDVHDTRTIRYRDREWDRAREMVSEQIAASLVSGFYVENPVTMAVRFQELSLPPAIELQTAIRQTQAGVLDIRRAMSSLRLLGAAHEAGVVSMHKSREAALNALLPEVEKECDEIAIIGSSLKGLLLEPYAADTAVCLRRKFKEGVPVRILLTHPLIADLRARQERRNPTDIGCEILKTLRLLRDWKVPCESVRLYMGTPTCFAMKTTRQMLINPFSYSAVSYTSPCLIVERPAAEGFGYWYDEFKRNHFDTWDTGLAQPIEDFDKCIAALKRLLPTFAENAAKFLREGRAPGAASA
jgi:hypothetical protein